MAISFRYRVSLLVVLAAIALLAVTAVALVLGSRSERDLSGIETRYVPLIELDRDLSTTFAQLTRALADAASAGEGSRIDDADKLRDELASRLAANHQIIAANGGDATSLEVELQLYYTPARLLSRELASGTSDGKLAAQVDAMHRTQTAFASHLTAATTPDRTLITAAFEHARAQQRASLWIDIAVAIGALLVMSLLSWRIIRTTVRSVHAVKAGVERLAAGTFDQEIVVESTDELGDLATEANRTAAHLREYREQVEQQHWIATGAATLTDAIAGELAVEVVADKALTQLADYVGASAGTIRVLDYDGSTRAVAEHGTVGTPLEITLPHGDRVMGTLALEVASTPRVLELLERVRTSIGIALRVAESRQENQEQLTATEAANRELETFSYSVSHDLRGPLRAVDGFSAALLEDCAAQLPPEGQDYLHRIRAAVQRMTELIEDLLRLSRVTRTEFHRERVELSALATTIIAELAHTEPERVVELSVAPEVTAAADPKLIRIVLENLLGNAWKFTSKQAVATIAFGVTDRVYFVRDNGAGFDMKYAEGLFGPFHRLHSDKEFTGTGIGLATVNRIIQRHGGRIWADAAVGAGATFYFTLPEPREPRPGD
ncbi:MAG: ATP-binding protein, partial [Kofleriaceae bacterium]